MGRVGCNTYDDLTFPRCFVQTRINIARSHNS